MEKVVIFGTKKVATTVFESIVNDEKSEMQIVGFCVDSEFFDSNELVGLPIVIKEDIFRKFPPDFYKVLVAVGYNQMNEQRAKKCEEFKEMGYELASFVHSGACIAKNAVIGKNVFIQGNVNIGCQSSISDNTFIFAGATVSHHCSVGKNCWIASGSVVGGESSVGNNCFLGISSIVGHETVIGSRNFIGAGAKVTKNTDKDSVFVVADTEKFRLNTDLFLRMCSFE